MRPSDTLRSRLLVVLHFLFGATALLGGGALVVWPRGEMLNLPVALLERSPFTDFLLPGVILYGVVGVHNLIAGVLVWKREPRAELASFSAGMAVLIWLIAETAMISAFHPLQLACGSLALLLVLDAVWIRRVRQQPRPALAHH